MPDYKLTYHVDMVFCIDATGSMRHVLDFVKQNALNLYRDVAAEMEKKHKTIDQLLGIPTLEKELKEYLDDLSILVPEWKCENPL